MNMLIITVIWHLCINNPECFTVREVCLTGVRVNKFHIFTPALVPSQVLLRNEQHSAVRSPLASYS